MKIETSKVTRLRLTELSSLDPVEVIADNIAENKGKVTITCFGKSWTAYWGGTGRDSVEEFFCSASNDYLIGCLSPMLDSRIADKDADGEFIKREILRARKNSELTRGEAASLWSDVDCYRPNRDSIINGMPRELAFFMGEEAWYLDWPTEENHEYTYLSRICDAVKAAYQQMKEQPHD